MRIAIIVLAALALTACERSGERTNVLTADGKPDVVVMDFSTPFALDPPPAGWRHRTFWTRGAMRMSFAEKDGVRALRAETRGTASMLFRHVDFDLSTHPILTWRWFIELPLDSALDERTREGDDHPARFYVVFRTQSGEERKLEIIWGNKLKAGEYKYIGSFPHYVADGGNENVGRWRDAEVDLREVYRRIWPDGAPARLVDIAIFCDSDETKGHTIAFFADVRLRRAPTQ